jgi:hypothetical protein
MAKNLIESCYRDWGHFAGGGANPEDTTFIDDKIKALLLL